MVAAHRLVRSRKGFVRNGLLTLLVFYFSWLFISSSYRFSQSRKVNPLPRSLDELEPEYDYIIVGGGQSGLVVANRLSEDGRYSILIVEPGPHMPDFHAVTRPWRPYNESAGHYQPPMLMMNMTTTPQPALDGRRGTLEAGYGVGGGSTVNGQLLNRGNAADYNAWEELGNPGWGWDGMFPYFRKSVTFHRPGQWLQDNFNVTWDDKAYGGYGPIHASYPAWAWPQQVQQARGWAELGLKRTREGAGGDATGIFWVPRTQDPHDETRSYSGNAHLLPALARGNTQLLSGFSVRRLALSNQSSIQADGVIIDQNKSEGSVPAVQRLILARKEVILAANLYSCIILQRSGIGSQEFLEAAGINVTVNLPGVGANFQDHPTTMLGFSYGKDFPISPSNLSADSGAAEMAENLYNASRSGPYIGGHNQLACLSGPDFLSPAELQWSMRSQHVLDHLPPVYRSEPSLVASYEAQRSIIIRQVAEHNTTLLESPIAGDSWTLLILQKPLSRGIISVNKTDPLYGEPSWDPNTLVNPADISILVSGLKAARRQQNSEAMKVLEPMEITPGTDVSSDEDIDKYVRRSVSSSIGHMSGTCAMMPRELGGVVDPELRVYGVGKLRVVDSSIIPLIPGANTMATVYAVAERAADIIRRRRVLRDLK